MPSYPIRGREFDVFEYSNVTFLLPCGTACLFCLLESCATLIVVLCRYTTRLACKLAQHHTMPTLFLTTRECNPPQEIAPKVGNGNTRYSTEGVNNSDTDRQFTSSHSPVREELPPKGTQPPHQTTAAAKEEQSSRNLLGAPCMLQHRSHVQTLVSGRKQTFQEIQRVGRWGWNAQVLE